MIDAAFQSIFYNKILPNSAAGAVFILLILAFRQITKRWSKGYVRVLWILLLAGMLLPPLPHGLFLSGGQMTDYAKIESQSKNDTAIIQSDSSSIEGSSSEENENIKSSLNNYSQQGQDIEKQKMTTPASQISAKSSIRVPETIRLWSARIWVAGAVVMFLCYLCQYILLRKKMKDAELVSGCNYWISAQTDAPFVLLGILPRIYLPVDLDGIQKDNILAHERQHIKNFDPMIKYISAAVLALYWFHPLVWLAVSLMGKDMEMYCDECVLRGKRFEERKEYSITLLEYAAQSNGLSFTMHFGESNTGNRIRHILNMKKPHFAVSLLLIVLICISGVLFLISKESGVENQPQGEERLTDGNQSDEGLAGTGNQSGEGLAGTGNQSDEGLAGAGNQSDGSQLETGNQSDGSQLETKNQKNGQSGGEGQTYRDEKDAALKYDDNLSELQKEWINVAAEQGMSVQEAQDWYLRFEKDELYAVTNGMHMIGCEYGDFDGNGEKDLFFIASFKQEETGPDFEGPVRCIHGYLNGKISYYNGFEDFSKNGFLQFQAEPSTENGIRFQICYTVDTIDSKEQTYLLKFNTKGGLAAEQPLGQSEKIIRMLLNVPKKEYESAVSYEKFRYHMSEYGVENALDDQVVLTYKDQTKDIYIYNYIRKNYEVPGTVINYKGTYSYFAMDILGEFLFYREPDISVIDIDGDSVEEIVCVYSLGHGTGIAKWGLTVFDVQADHTILGYNLEEYDMVQQVGKLIYYDKEHGKVEIGKDGKVKKEMDLTAAYEYEEYADKIEINYSNVYTYAVVDGRMKLQAEVLAEIGPTWYMDIEDSWTEFDVSFKDGKFLIDI